MPTTSQPVPVAITSLGSLRATLAGVERAGGAYLVRVLLDAHAELEDGQTIRLEGAPVRVRVRGPRRRAPSGSVSGGPQLSVLRCHARAEGPLVDGATWGPSGVIAIDIDAEVPSERVRLRSSASRVRVVLGPGRPRLTAIKAAGQTAGGEPRGRLAVLGVKIDGVHREGSSWWADMLLDLEATIGRKRVRERAVPAAVRLYHQRLARRSPTRTR